ncbi:MAG: type II toxin-antitoxin system HicB family antitoxin [Burkholderiales bacterium]|jgi:predicted RNase H-like HicB family nuclease
MRYPIAIEPGTRRRAWGVVVPDLPGCFSAADSGIDEAIDKAREAIAIWIEAAVDAGEAIPAPSPIDLLRKSPDYAGWVWAVVDVDPAILDETVERVNITLPRRVLARLDAKARQAGESRSGFIARLALAAK